MTMPETEVVTQDEEIVTESQELEPVETPQVPVIMGRFRFTRRGMEVDGEAPLEEWGEAVRAMAVLCGGLQLCIGDLLNYGEDRYGEMAAQYIDSADWSESTVRVYQWTARQVPMENRIDGLSVGHYMAAARLPQEKQREHLERAKEGDDGVTWPVARLKKYIAGGGDAVEPVYTLTVRFTNEDDMTLLKNRLESDGFTVEVR